MTTGSAPACTILVGPEAVSRLHDTEFGLAPRIDYRLVAEPLKGMVVECSSSPTGLRGHRMARVLQSLGGNLRIAGAIARQASADALIYSTGETWGLPVALVGALRSPRRFAHVVYAHRVYSPAWLRFLRLTRGWLAVDGWICITQHQAGLLRRALGPGGPPVRVVSQGVDTAFFDPDKVPTIETTPYLLSVGTEMRNYSLLCDAVRGLPIDVVIKASSSWMASGRSRLGRIPSNVRLLTQSLSYADLRALYSGATAVVIPLYDTPQAAGITTILEAMAMGKSVVATRSTGLPDVLVSEKTGLICDATADALAAAVMRHLRAPSSREELAAAGRDAVLSGYTVEHHARAIADVLLTARR